ncbi:MAG: imelysin family protein [Chloroflexota bacterium]
MKRRLIVWLMVSTVCVAVVAACTGVVLDMTPIAVTQDTAAEAPTAVPAPMPTETSIPTLPVLVDGQFDRRAMLTNIANVVILPAHERLAAESAQLQFAIEQFAAEPTAETLITAQEQWVTTAAAGSSIEPFMLRFTMLIRGQIKKWPINTKFIEDFIADTEQIDEPFISSIGSTSKGLGALEYLLFAVAENDIVDSDTAIDDEILATLTANPQRTAYLVASAQNLTITTARLNEMWSAEGGNQAQRFIDADDAGNNVQGSISILANEMIALVEGMVKDKIDEPLQGAYAEAQPEAVESPYGQASVPLMVANLRSAQNIMHAGFGEYLGFLGQSELADAIDSQFEKAIGTLEEIAPSLQVAVIDSPDAVQAARDEVKALLVLLKVDMANQMSITVTFSDNDGD